MVQERKGVLLTSIKVENHWPRGIKQWKSNLPNCQASSFLKTAFILKEVFFSSACSIIMIIIIIYLIVECFELHKNLYILLFPLKIQNNVRQSHIINFHFADEETDFLEVQSHTMQKCQSSLYSNPYFPILDIGFPHSPMKPILRKVF